MHKGSQGSSSTHSSSTNSRQDQEEAGSDDQEDDNDNDEVNIEHERFPGLGVEGVDAVEEGHFEAGRICGRRQGWMMSRKFLRHNLIHV